MVLRFPQTIELTTPQNTLYILERSNANPL
jgi:hypothetical protein